MSGQRVRLVGGAGPWEGQLHVFQAGKWRPVTANRWTNQESRVVCRQLGYVRSELATDGGVSMSTDGVSLSRTI